MARTAALPILTLPTAYDAQLGRRSPHKSDSIRFRTESDSKWPFRLARPDQAGAAAILAACPSR